MPSTAVTQTPGATPSRIKQILSEASVKVLLVGDIHLSDRAPASCTPSYTDDILDMLSHVAKLERGLGADAVVWAGDIFHHKQPSRTSHATVQKLSRVAQQFVRPPLVVTGNHDIMSDRLDSLEKQPLGVLYAAGVLQELDGWHDTLPIFGVPWQQRWHSPGTIWDAFDAYRDRDDEQLSRSLVVTHAPIYPPAVADNVMFELLPLDEVSEAMHTSGYLYYGHIHEFHGVFKFDGVTYANMGSLSREALTDYNRTRKIQVTLWTPEHGFTSIDIPHKPASEVFKLEVAQEKKSHQMSLDSFLDEVGSATLDISSTSAIIDHVRRMDIEEPVKEISIQLLEEVAE